MVGESIKGRGVGDAATPTLTPKCSSNMNSYHKLYNQGNTDSDHHQIPARPFSKRFPLESAYSLQGVMGSRWRSGSNPGSNLLAAVSKLGQYRSYHVATVHLAI